MSIFGDVLSSVLNIRNITEPVFVKEFDKNNSQLNDLIELSRKVVSNKKEIILRDIQLLKYGLEGEKNVYYELKNSFIPMLCLHDIRLEYKDYTAYSLSQGDFEKVEKYRDMIIAIVNGSG